MFAELAGGITVLLWLYLLLGRGMFWRIHDHDSGAAPDSAARRSSALFPRVAVVIPARDEARYVGRTVASLTGQQYSGPLHIFLVDDASEDGTADSALEAARAAAKPDHLTVVRAGAVPDGWTGKLWALAEGVRCAESFAPDYVLFSDADIVHSPDSVSQLVGRAEAGGYEMVSFMVKLECETFAEKALIPAFVFFFFMLYPPRWTEDRAHATAGAAGGCVLLRWPALARIGGISAIGGQLIDDCALAKAVKQAGGKIWLGITSQTRSIRSYGGFGALGRMISRTAFRQLRHSAVLLVGTTAGMFVTYMLPPLLLLGSNPVSIALGGIAWMLMTVAYFPCVRFYGLPVLWAPALPVVALFYTGATIHSAVEYWSGRGGEWKGRIQDRKA